VNNPDTNGAAEQSQSVLQFTTVMKYVSYTTVYCGYTRYARVYHSRQWYNYNMDQEM